MMWLSLCVSELLELVENEWKPAKDGSLQQLVDAKSIVSADGDAEAEEEPNDPDSGELCTLLLETPKRNRPKALCYEDVLMMVGGPYYYIFTTLH